MPSWKKVILSGSDASLNSLAVSTNVTASSFTGSFTGSFLGTASYAIQALSASYAPGTSQTLQQVTTNGNTTTNSIAVAGITNDGNLFLSGSNRLVYNNSVSSSLLFGFFDGSSIYGPYYQIFGNNYSNVTQRGSAEYVFDTRNGGESGFNVAEFNGSTWLRKFRVSQAGIEVTGSTISTGGFTGSLQGTASYAISASHAISADTASFLPSTTNLNITSISASTAVFTSASIGFLTTVSGSATIIGDAYVVVNSSQATRYAGLAVYESGSVPPTTASWNFDSQNNDWFYGYSSSNGTDYGVALFGPAYTTEGSPTYLTNNRIPKSSGSHHLTDSNLTDSGSRVSSAVPFTVTGSITASVGFLGNLTGTSSYATQALSASYAVQALSSSYALTASFANTASYVATASYTPNLQQVTTKGNTTTNTIIVSSSLGNSILTVDTGSILVSNLIDGPVFGKTHHIIYDAISITANSTTTIAQLPAPAVAGFTFDYIAYVSGGVLQAGRAGVVKGILRNTETGVVTKAFQINETTTLDLEDDGFGTAGLQFNIVQDTNGTSNQLVAITNNNWPYIINYTLTIYYNPNFS